MAGTLFSCSQSLSKKDITLVSVEEKDIILNLQEVQLIDVRTAIEYESGHINNSQNIDCKLSTFNEDILSLDKDKPVVLYCERGTRSAKSVKKLHKIGFKKLYDLKGGFQKWKSEKLDLNIKH